jgi:hypothetical protein
VDDDMTITDPLIVLDKDMITELFVDYDMGIFNHSVFIQLLRAEMRAAGAPV